jgi:cell division protein FtsB
MLAVSGTVIAALAVLPARTWMTQRRERIEVESELERLNGDVAQLDAQLGLLRTDAEIERRARENFDLVFPGEESYRILPKAQD